MWLGYLKKAEQGFQVAFGVLQSICCDSIYKAASKPPSSTASISAAGLVWAGVEFHDGVLVFQAHFGLVHAVYAFEDAGNAFHAAAAGHAVDIEGNSLHLYFLSFTQIWLPNTLLLTQTACKFFIKAV